MLEELEDKLTLDDYDYLVEIFDKMELFCKNDNIIDKYTKIQQEIKKISTEEEEQTKKVKRAIAFQKTCRWR